MRDGLGYGGYNEGVDITTKEQLEYFRSHGFKTLDPKSLNP